MCSGASAGSRLAAVGMAKYAVTFCSKPLFLDRLEHSYLVTDGESFWLAFTSVPKVPVRSRCRRPAMCLDRAPIHSSYRKNNNRFCRVRR
jgi:hypothetical protein